MTKPKFHYWAGDELPSEKKSIEIPDELWDSFIHGDYCTDCDDKCVDYTKISKNKCSPFHTFLYEVYDGYRKGVVSEDVAHFLLEVLYRGTLTKTVKHPFSFEINGKKFTAVGVVWRAEKYNEESETINHIGTDLIVYKTKK